MTLPVSSNTTNNIDETIYSTLLDIKETIGYENQNYFVMDYIEESPPNEISRKPTVQSNLISEFSWKDYNDKDWTSSAKNQGPCGSCWAFAAVSCLESIINIAWDDPNLDVDLSEQYILSCLSRSGSCSGGNSYTAFKYIERNGTSGNDCNGIPLEECLFYQADDSVSCNEKSIDWNQNLVPITNYGYWRPNFPEDIDAIKTDLINRGPLVTYFLATGSFSQWGGSHHSPNDYYPYEQGDGANHAVIIVGFKDDPSIENGGYWICKNSWGTNWGYDGFFNIEYGSLNIDNVEITWVEYEPNPLVDFSHLPENPKAKESINFNDISTSLKGEIETRYWDFGDGTTSTQKNPMKSYSEIGKYNVNFTVSDSYGHMNSISKNVFVGDEIPPITNHKITGTLGENDWYLSTIGIRLDASDSFSGVECIMYSLDGSDYQKYSPLFLSAKSYQGEHTLSYYSIDRSGNIEDEKTCSFKIDSFNPEATILKPLNGTLYIMNVPFIKKFDDTMIIGPLLPKFEFFDSTSGIDEVHYYLNNRRIDVDDHPPYTCIINKFHLGKECSFKVRVYDNSGRSSESETIYFKQFSIGLLRKIF